MKRGQGKWYVQVKWKGGRDSREPKGDLKGWPVRGRNQGLKVV
jgi:hypothetical protein